jgi:hypothetical protein
MTTVNEFRTLEFFRKVRDEQAAFLAEKTPEEIIKFFSSFHPSVESMVEKSKQDKEERIPSTVLKR